MPYLSHCGALHNIHTNHCRTVPVSSRNTPVTWTMAAGSDEPVVFKALREGVLTRLGVKSEARLNSDRCVSPMFSHPPSSHASTFHDCLI